MDFPRDYPTSCLLGCVDVLDCLPQEDYREKVKADVLFIVCVVRFPVS